MLVELAPSTPEAAEQKPADSPLLLRLRNILKEASHLRNIPLLVFELPQAIVIKGKVRSYYQKQIAQEAVMQFLVQGEYRHRLQNEIVVVGRED